MCVEPFVTLLVDDIAVIALCSSQIHKSKHAMNFSCTINSPFRRMQISLNPAASQVLSFVKDLLTLLHHASESSEGSHSSESEGKRPALSRSSKRVEHPTDI